MLMRQYWPSLAGGWRPAGVGGCSDGRELARRVPHRPRGTGPQRRYRLLGPNPVPHMSGEGLIAYLASHSAPYQSSLLFAGQPGRGQSVR
jgi:hypothetical protein